MGILQARIVEWVYMPSSRGSPNPGIKLRSPAFQVNSLPSEPPGKSKNTGVGSLSLLQGIFPTQKSNRGRLHHRWILYQLSHRGRPFIYIHIHTHRHTYIYTHTHTHTHTYIHIYMYMAFIYYLVWQYLLAMWPGMQVKLMCESNKSCSKMPSPC